MCWQCCWWWWLCSCCCGSCCCWRWGSGYGFESGLALGTGSKCLKTASQRCGGTSRGQREFLACCRGSGAACLALGGTQAALASAVAFLISAAERGEEEVEDDEEDKDKGEVVVSGDAGCAAFGRGQLCRLRRPPPLPPRGRWRPASWAVGLQWVAGRPRLRSGGLEGRPGWQRCMGEESGCRLHRLSVAGMAPAICEGVRVSVCGGQKCAWAAFGRRAGRA